MRAAMIDGLLYCRLFSFANFFCKSYEVKEVINYNINKLLIDIRYFIDYWKINNFNGYAMLKRKNVNLFYFKNMSVKGAFGLALLCVRFVVCDVSDLLLMYVGIKLGLQDVLVEVSCFKVEDIGTKLIIQARQVEFLL